MDDGFPNSYTAVCYYPSLNGLKVKYFKELTKEIIQNG
jgi:hypothetical protein